VTIFEMGRGAGGRMATRKTRDMPGLAINHGAPLFVASHDSFRDLIAPLVASGSVREWAKWWTSMQRLFELNRETSKNQRVL
jgi:predicted NAD/FAD-dependent oxidoreductase